MLMFAAALMASASVSAAPGPKPVGACAWGRLSAAEKTQILDAYHEDRGAGLVVLMSMEAQVAAAIAACAPGSQAPAVFLHRALWAEMTQQGAVRELAAHGVQRATLEAAWTAAPAARTCLRNRLGPTFGVRTPDCKDYVEVDMAKALKLAQPDAEMQASIFYLARAEGELAESVIANSPFD